MNNNNQNMDIMNQNLRIFLLSWWGYSQLLPDIPTPNYITGDSFLIHRFTHS